MSGLLLVDGDIARPGTALATSIHGSIGDWSRLDLLVARALDVKLPEDRQTVAWKEAQQARIKVKRAARARALEASG